MKPTAGPRAAVTCKTCGHHYARDPVLEVPCPSCGARVGQWCRRPSEHSVGKQFWRGWHTARDLAAAAAGAYHHRCTRPCPQSCGVCHPRGRARAAGLQLTL